MHLVRQLSQNTKALVAPTLVNFNLLMSSVTSQQQCWKVGELTDS